MQKRVKKSRAANGLTHMAKDLVPETPSNLNGEGTSKSAMIPLAGACAGCKDPKTANDDFKMSRCGRCKLTRYCG